MKKHLLILCFIFIILSNLAYAAHTFDTKISKNTSASPAVQAFTVGSGGTLLVVSIMTTTSGLPSTAVTYNGTSLTRAGTSLGDTGGEGTAEIWYMINPPTGVSLNVNVTGSATGFGDMSYVISSYKAQSGYISELDSWNSTSSGGAANPNLVVQTTIAGDVVVDAMFDGDMNVASANNQILLYKLDTGAENWGAQYYLNAGTGGVRMNWTTPSDDYQYFAASFKEVQIPLPNVTLNSPINIITTSNSVDFNCTANATSPTTLSAIKFYLNSTVNATNNTPISNIPWTNELTLSNGNYTWNCEANDSLNRKGNGTESWVYVNYTIPLPVSVLNSPLGVITKNSFSIFNCTANATSPTTLSAIKLYINGTVNQTNNTPISNTPWITNISFSVNGNYTWNCEANDSLDRKSNGTESWLYINVSTFSLNITNPTTSNPLTTNSSQNISLYFNFLDTNINITSNVYLNSVKFDSTELINLGGTTEGFEDVTFPPSGWGTIAEAGSNIWFRNTSIPILGTGSAQSGVTGDSGESWMYYVKTYDIDGTISFDWKVSSEKGYDYLCYCLDKRCGATGCLCSNKLASDANITSSSNGVWTSGSVTKSVPAGTHNFTWCYAKDSSGKAGNDTGIVDNITFIYVNPNYNLTYNAATGWEVNITTPILSDGTKDLYIQAIYNNTIIRNDTEIAAIIYGSSVSLSCVYGLNISNIQYRISSLSSFPITINATNQTDIIPVLNCTNSASTANLKMSRNDTYNNVSDICGITNVPDINLTTVASTLTSLTGGTSTGIWCMRNYSSYLTASDRKSISYSIILE